MKECYECGVPTPEDELHPIYNTCSNCTGYNQRQAQEDEDARA